MGSSMTSVGLFEVDVDVNEVGGWVFFQRKSSIFAPVMTKEELILDCRYYNGEDEVPASLPEGKEIFWD
jgi:hypothetical protein